MLADLWYVCDSLGFWGKKAKKYLADERVKTHSPLLLGKKVIVRYRPLGVVGVIGPWNYPLTNTFGDVHPRADGGQLRRDEAERGDAAHEPARGRGRRGGRAARRACSPVATGAGETGAALVDNVDMIMFTGSTRTGKKIMARAAERLIPVSLELGGKDPMIVLGDADLERAANMAVQWAMSNSGQICMAVERVYVEEPVYDEFVASVVEKVARAAPGRARRARHRRRRRDDVPAADRDRRAPRARRGRQGRAGARRREARRRARAASSSRPCSRASTTRWRCMSDETFGPVLPIMKVRDAEEAVKLANDSRYGLNSSVFTKDVAKGERDRAPARGRQRLRERRAHELPGPGGAVRRHGRVGARRAARAAGHPQVLPRSRRSWSPASAPSTSRRCSPTSARRRRSSSV